MQVPMSPSLNMTESFSMFISLSCFNEVNKLSLLILLNKLWSENILKIFISSSFDKECSDNS